MENVKTVVDDEKVLGTKQAGAAAAAGTHFDAGLSKEDKARVEAYRQMYYDAEARGDTAAMAAAHEAAEYVRAGYGYSGGADGSEYLALPQKLTVPEYTAGTRVEDYSPYLVQMHQAQKQSAMAELKNAYNNNVAALDRAEAGLAGTYQAARNQAAGAHEQERRNFAQYAAANGLNSGTAGQAELARSVTLQNNMNDIHTAEASAMADLTLRRAEAENEYNAAIAQAEHTGEYELAAALYEEKVRVQEALTEAEIRRQQYALEQYQLQYQAQRDTVADRQYAREQALKEKAQADDVELAWAEQKLKETIQNGELDLAWAKLTKEEQLALLELALAQKKQEDATTLAWAELGLPSDIYESLEMGKPEKALARLDTIWDTLSEAQRKKTQEMLAGYGYTYTP